MEFRDYGILFEETVTKYLGEPETTIYFASIYHKLEETRAILFTICISELNMNKSNYDIKDLEQLNEFESKLLEDTDYSIVRKCIDFLHK